MKKNITLCALIGMLFTLSACNSAVTNDNNTLKKNEDSVKKEAPITERTVENSIIDNKDLQIWYEVEVSELEDAKNAEVNRVYLIKNNEIADLVLDSPGYSSDMTVEMYNENNNTNITQKEILTLGEITKLDNKEILSKLTDNYKNKETEGYELKEEFEYYPIGYNMKTDGTGNSMELIDLEYGDHKKLHFYEPMGSCQVYEGYFIGYWSKMSTYESGSEYTRQTLTYTETPEARFLYDEPNEEKFVIK